MFDTLIIDRYLSDVCINMCTQCLQLIVTNIDTFYIIIRAVFFILITKMHINYGNILDVVQLNYR